MYGAISALMLLAHAWVDASLGISIIAAAAPQEASLTVSSTTNDFIKTAEYETVTLALHQCERHHSVFPDTLSASVAHHACDNRQHHSGSSSPRGNCPNKHGIPMAREHVQITEETSQCRRYGQYCHWNGDPNNDGSHKPGAMSSPNPVISAGDAVK